MYNFILKKTNFNVNLLKNTKSDSILNACKTLLRKVLYINQLFY